jgi:AraC-like DNA-binding protein
MPTSCLARSGPGQGRSPLTLLDVEASEGLPDVAEPLRSFFAIAILRLLEGQTDIDGMAALAGIGVQQLQRCLRREGLSYRDLLALIRSARAKALLRETDLSITEVAFALGYSDHANFTRAFNRWAGCSPVDFRRRVALPPVSVGGGASPRSPTNGAKEA